MIRTDDEDSTDLEIESEVEGESNVYTCHRMLRKCDDMKRLVTKMEESKRMSVAQRDIMYRMICDMSRLAIVKLEARACLRGRLERMEMAQKIARNVVEEMMGGETREKVATKGCTQGSVLGADPVECRVQLCWMWIMVRGLVW